MRWIDYRQCLGVGFGDQEKFRLLQNKIHNLLNISRDGIGYTGKSYFQFCMMTGRRFCELRSPLGCVLSILGDEAEDLGAFLSDYIAFVNTFEQLPYSSWDRQAFINLLRNMMQQSGLPIEIYKDADGYFVFPEGAAELDESLVSCPLLWLRAYPAAYKSFSTALKQYAKKEYIRDTADNLRKALEAFLQAFFENERNLSNNIPIVGAYLKNCGAPREFCEAYVKLADLYRKLNDRAAKHNDAIDARFLEFLLYQTGMFIRLLLTLRAEPQHPENTREKT